MDLSKQEQASAALCRQILKLKTFDDIYPSDLESGNEKRDYAAVASAIYLSRPFQDIIKQIQFEHMKTAALEASNMLEVSMSRGTINGADLVEERFRQLHLEHIATVPEPAKDEEQFNPIGKV